METYLYTFATKSTDLIFYPFRELKLYMYRTESIVVTKKLQKFHVKIDCVVNEICV